MIRTKTLWLAAGALAAVVAGLVYASSQFGLNKLAECCADSITTGSESTDECCSESSASGTSDSPRIDANREIVFAVEGLTCPAVDGIGCGHLLGPVLQRIDSIAGVEAASANHTGNMVRVTVKSAAKREDVAAVIEKELATDYSPQRIIGGDFQNALNQQTWREKQRIRELSAIEFRILVLRRISAFAKSEELPEDVTAELRELAERKWDLLSANAEVTESGKLPDETDWRQRLREFASRFFEEAKPLLTEDQFDRLRSLADGIDGESTAEHE